MGESEFQKSSYNSMVILIYSPVDLAWVLTTEFQWLDLLVRVFGQIAGYPFDTIHE